MKKLVFLLLLASLIISCSDDGVKDKDFVSQMKREAKCIAIAEYFFKYRSAQEHYEHGLDAGMRQANLDGATNKFRNYIEKARQEILYQDKYSKADFYITMCDEKLRQYEVKNK